MNWELSQNVNGGRNFRITCQDVWSLGCNLDLRAYEAGVLIHLIVAFQLLMCDVCSYNHDIKEASVLFSPSIRPMLTSLIIRKVHTMQESCYSIMKKTTFRHVASCSLTEIQRCLLPSSSVQWEPEISLSYSILFHLPLKV
jgi:hypothetical protein